jgi:hypothetical protein
MPEPSDAPTRPVPLDYAAGAFPPVARAVDGTRAFATAKFLVIVLLFAVFQVAIVMDGSEDGPCLTVCGAPFVAGIAGLIGVVVLNLTLGRLGATACRGTPGARRAFAVAGAASVVALMGVSWATGTVLEALNLMGRGMPSSPAMAAIFLGVILAPAVAVDVAIGFALARWGRCRPLAPPAAATDVVPTQE